MLVPVVRRLLSCLDRLAPQLQLFGPFPPLKFFFFFSLSSRRLLLRYPYYENKEKLGMPSAVEAMEWL